MLGVPGRRSRPEPCEGAGGGPSGVADERGGPGRASGAAVTRGPALGSADGRDMGA